VYLGAYVRIDGARVSGPSLSDLVAEGNPALDAEMRQRLMETMMALGRLKTAAEAGFAYDEMLARGNVAGERLIMGGVDALIAQTRSIERIVAHLGLGGIAFEGSDSLDNPSAVFQ
jgi:putative iron-regulated protein